ncbi:MAG TPA: glutathione S-transferase family protein [Burkholderiales bacterium]|nr:glutathione S-transferase family protein [Burkholderiales bacterium]
MKLYCHPASTTSRIVMMFAAEEGVDLEYQTVDLFTGEHLKPEFAAINPNCLVPVLEEGDFRLTESAAIIRYLADKVGSPAYPKDLKARARVNEIMDWFNSNCYKDIAYGLAYPQLFPHHKRPSDAVQAGTLAWGKERATAWLNILDKNWLGPNKQFLCGDRVTLADYMGAEMVALGEVIRCDFKGYPNVQRWLKNMKALKSWPKLHEVIDGFAASVKGQSFVAV